MKRYAEYKDSGIEWIGKIPSDWEVCKLKHIFADGENGIKIGPFGSALKGKTLSEGDYKIYNQAHLIQNDFSIDRHFVSKDTFNELISYEVHSGDILFSMMGTIGKCRIMPNGFPHGIMDSHLLKAKLNDKCLPEYFQYVYDKDNSNIVIEQLLFYSNGSIMNGLNSSIIKNVYLSFPNKENQQKIVDYLDYKTIAIDTLIADKQKLIDLLKEKRQAIISEAVTKGLDKTVKMKDSGIEWIGEIPAHWVIKPLFVVALENNIKNIGLRCDNLLSLSYGKIITKDIETNFGLLPESFETYQIVQEGYTILRLTDLQNDKRSLRTGYVRETGIITSAYVGLIPTEQIDGRFLSDLLFAYDLMKIFYGLGNGVRQSMNYKDLKWLPVLAPPLAEQNQISQFIFGQTENIDRLVADITVQIEKLKEYRQSVISEAVTGKVAI